jgi:hypothetical protein
MIEKINKNERKNKAEIITEMPGEESAEFWTVLGSEDGMPGDNTVVVMNPQILSFSVISYPLLGARGGTVVALRYKPEVCWIDSRWCHWNFSLT